MRDVPPLAGRGDAPRFHVPPVRAVRDRSPVSALPGTAGRAVRRVRVHRRRWGRRADAAEVAPVDRHDTPRRFRGPISRLMRPRAKLLPRIGASPAITFPGRNFCHESRHLRQNVPGRTPRLTPSAGATHTPPTSRRWAMNGTSTRRASAERPGGWWKPGWRRRRMDPGASGPNGRRPAANAANRPPSRLRRRAPAIQGSADRQGPGRRPDSQGRRSRSAAQPNEGGTAEGTTFRPGTNGRS